MVSLDLAGRVLHLELTEDGGAIIGDGHVTHLVHKHFVQTHRT